MPEPAKVLTIAGSDSGGAAGLQADLKTFTALGAYGMSAVTVVTAQNSASVRAVHRLPPPLVIQQIEAVLDDYGAAAVKTGFMGDAGLVVAVARSLQAYRARRTFSLIVDPVLVNHRREAMFTVDVAQAYRDHLIPLCDLVTPNAAEAALLLQQQVSNLAEMKAAGEQLHLLGARAVLVTGGRDRDQAVDVLFDGQTATELRTKWIDTPNTHGAGDTLSAAVAVFRAQGKPPVEALRLAQAFTAQAIAAAAAWRLGSGHGPLSHFRQ